MAIKDWPAEERPREKLLLRGAASLSDAELLAIFLRTGVHGKSAVDMSRDLLSHFGSLSCLISSSQENFCSARGLGQAKYVQLQAVLEMARRYTLEELKRDGCIENAGHVKDLLVQQLRAYEHEVFACLWLDSQHRVIDFEVMFQGTIDTASVYPREVVKSALKQNAAAVIFSHNHPSGVAEPSQSDKTITAQLKNALELVQVRVLDHFVVGSGEPVSMAEKGYM